MVGCFEPAAKGAVDELQQMLVVHQMQVNCTAA